MLEGTFTEASHVMSPTGMETYLEGAKALANLGRGKDLVISYLQQMPLVAKECGEDIITDCLSAAMKLASMTSGEVITLLFDSLPTASRRLGDAELVRGYLTLIHQLSATAARGLRPMLGHIDELLSKLTLSGLRRWANFDAQAYRMFPTADGQPYAPLLDDTNPAIAAARTRIQDIDNRDGNWNQSNPDAPKFDGYISQ